MKTLIENSIEIKGMGHPDTKTIFNSEDRTHMRFKSLTTISGRKLTVDFKFEENEVESSDKLQMVIPVSDDEIIIKDFILNKINEYLS